MGLLVDPRGGKGKSISVAKRVFSFLPELDQLSLDSHTSHMGCRGGSVEKRGSRVKTDNVRRGFLSGDRICAPKLG